MKAFPRGSKRRSDEEKDAVVVVVVFFLFFCCCFFCFVFFVFFVVFFVFVFFVFFYFACHYWQRPILINCVMSYYLCVLRRLIRPILALNCLLQIEQERSEEESSGFPLCTFLLGFADSFCFVFTSSPSYEASPICTILCNLFPGLCWYVEVFKGGLSLFRFFWPPWERFPACSSP